MAKIQIRRDTAAAWASANPVLSMGEPGMTTDTGVLAYGDGVTAWNKLPKLRVGADKTFAWSDAFAYATNTVIGSTAGWWEQSYYANQGPTVNASQQMTGSNGSNFAVTAASVPTLTPYSAQIDVIALQTGAGGTNTGVALAVGAVATGSRTYNSGTSGPALIARLRGQTGGFAIETRSPVGDNAAPTILAQATQAVAAGSALRVEVDAANVVTFKYGAATLWSGQMPPAIVGRQVGIASDSSSNVMDNFTMGYAAI